MNPIKPALSTATVAETLKIEAPTIKDIVNGKVNPRVMNLPVEKMTLPDESFGRRLAESFGRRHAQKRADRDHPHVTFFFNGEKDTMKETLDADGHRIIEWRNKDGDIVELMDATDGYSVELKKNGMLESRKLGKPDGFDILA